MKMKKRLQFRPLPLALLLLILFIAGSFIYYTCRIESINRNFQSDPRYDDWNYNKIDQIMTHLREEDFDLTIPAVHQSLSFTVPSRITVYDHTSEWELEKGDQVTTDFVTYSSRNMYRSTRAMVITVNGREHDIRVSARDMARLYMAALEQNDLTETFRTEFGKKLSYNNAREALRTIDRQLYQRGVTNPMDYPFDKYFWKGLLEVSVYLAPVALVALSILLSFGFQQHQYHTWLRQYNREHCENWDTIAGTLPQFKSLRSSGLNMAPKEPQKKPTLIDAIKNIFKPI